MVQLVILHLQLLVVLVALVDLVVEQIILVWVVLEQIILDLHNKDILVELVTVLVRVAAAVVPVALEELEDLQVLVLVMEVTAV